MPCADALRRASAAARSAARDRRQRDDLSPPLPRHRPARAGARPAGRPTRPTRARSSTSSRALAEHVERLPRAGGEALRTAEERTAIAALARLRLARAGGARRRRACTASACALADVLGAARTTTLVALSERDHRELPEPRAATRALAAWGTARSGVNYRVRHATRYAYAQPVAIAHNEVRLTPRSGGVQQRAPRRSSRSSPPPSVLSQQHDYFGNTVHFFTLQEPHHELTVTAVSDVERHARAAGRTRRTRRRGRTVRDRAARSDPARAGSRRLPVRLRVAATSRWDAATAAYAAPSFPPGRPLLEAALDLTRRIHAEFRYDPARPRSRRRSPRCWSAGAASVRTSPTSRSPACARSAWRRATSAATC